MPSRSSGVRRLEKANLNMGVALRRDLLNGSRDLADGPNGRNGAELTRYDVQIGDPRNEADLLGSAARSREAGLAAADRRALAAAAPANHGQNLVPLVEPAVLERLTAELLREIDSAKQSRQDWLDLMTNGVKALGFDRRTQKRDTPFPGASAAVHPAFAQACIDHQARSAGQLCPPDGPAKACVEGKSAPEREDAADRVARYVNWQCTRQITEWAPETERLLMMIGPEGSSFKKVWYDPFLRRPRVQYVPSEFVIAPYSASCEQTTPLLAEELRVFGHEVRSHVASGFWVPHDPGPAPAFQPSEVEQARRALTGSQPSGETIQGHDPHTYYEAQVRRVLPGFENDQASEWLITLHPASQQIVAIYRHWNQDDPARERRRLLMHYKMFPWDGFYGIGLFHLIGGLSLAATGALRALLDSAMAATMGGGLKLGHGRANGGTIVTGPGQWADVQAAGVDDIRKAILPNIFQPPSSVLFELLQFLVGASQEFASVALKEVAESNANVPVGTTLARLDEGSRVYSGIYQRLHRVQALELEAIYKIDAKTLPQQLEWRPFPDPELSPADFGRDISVAPVSDPRTYSAVQRTMKAQSQLELAERAQPYGVKANMRKAFVAAGEAMGLPDMEELFPEDLPPTSGDPFTENLAVVRGQALEAKPDHPHEEHLEVHLALLMVPGMAQTPTGQNLVQHMHQHASTGALAIAASGYAAKQAGLLLPEATDPGQWYAGWMQRIGEATKPMADPGIERVAEVEKAKVEASREKTEIETEAKKEIVAVETAAKLKVVEAQNDAKLAEIDAADDAKEADLAVKVQTDREKIASQERQKAADIAAKAAMPPPASKPPSKKG